MLSDEYDLIILDEVNLANRLNAREDGENPSLPRNCKRSIV
jgi:hypothetical protein